MNRLQAYLHTTDEGRKHLRVRQAEYSDALRNDLYQVASPATWSSSTWEWDYPLTPAAISSLSTVAERWHLPIEWSAELRVYAEGIQETVAFERKIRMAIAKTLETPDEPVNPLPTNMAIPPMRHQSIASQWGVRVTCLYLAWDPGLGKTRAATDITANTMRLGYLRPMESVWIPRVTEVVPAVVAVDGTIIKPSTTRIERHERWGVRGGVLVVCPKSVVSNWQVELKKWQNLSSVTINGEASRKRKRAGTRTHVHICSYGSLHHVLDNDYDLVIVDEVHRCSNNSEQTARVTSLSLKARRRIVLSGTPVTNSPESVFFQMLICDHGRALGANKQAFLDRYFTPVFELQGNKPATSDEHARAKYAPKAGASEAIAQAMSHCTYFLRKEEAVDLPPKTFVTRWVEMTVEQAKYYQQIKKEAVTMLQDGEVTAELIISKIAKLRQIAQGVARLDDGSWRTFSNSKVEELKELLTTNLFRRKVVVWCSFKFEMDQVALLLQAYGIQYVRLDGDSGSDNKRKALFDRWNTDPHCCVFLVQLQISEGYTIHANECQVPCYDSVYLGMTWSFVEWVQSQDRIHRIGQRYACNYTVILTTTGIDRTMYAAVQDKAMHSSAVYVEGKDYYKRLLTDDVPGLAALTAA